MGTLRRIAGKTKAFFIRITGQPRLRKGNEGLTESEAGEHGRRSVTSTRDDGMGSLPVVAGGGEVCDDCQEASTTEAGNTVDAAGKEAIDVVHEPLPPPPGCPPSQTLHSPVENSPPRAIPFAQGYRPHLAPPVVLESAKPSSHSLQIPSQHPRSLTSGTSGPDVASASSNYFSNASGFSIGQMNTVQNFGSSKTLLDYLEPYISHGAAYNSDERCDAPVCYPETRRAVQEDIVSWMRDGEVDDPGRTIMWLAGPAGSGKTAIAGSVTETCKEAGLLAASFFFSSVSGSADRHSKQCVVATIALHLSEHEALSHYKVQLMASIDRNPTIFRKRLIDQAHCLLLEPFRAIREQSDTNGWPKSILLDGLDEVLVDMVYDAKGVRFERTDEEDQLEILEVLLVLAKDPAFPFRIFISSRPERVINDFFATTARDTAVPLFLDSKYDPDSDIRRFLHSKFASIRRRYGIHDASWPGQQAFDRIVEMSSGQFIVPATIVRHIAAGVPQRQLDDIMQLQWVDTGRKNPFAVVDALYTCILRRSPEPHLAAKWLCVYTRTVRDIPASYYRRFVEDVEGEFHHVLGPLSSLVSIPTSGENKAPLMIFHKSLSDYFYSQSRCTDFYLDEETMEAFVAERCVCVLRHNGPIASLSNSPQEIGRFFDEFYAGTLLCLLRIGRKGRHSVHVSNASYYELVSHTFMALLLSISPDAQMQLASCDVAWWTRLCLGDSEYQTKRFDTVFDTVFISGMYCGIHANLCRSSSRTSTSTPVRCHAACTHWRAGILAEAKALDWCVHKLEEAGLSELGQAKKKWFDQRFKKMGEQEDGTFATCSICQPLSLI